MPPSPRITKAAILEAGLALLRLEGPDALNARALAAHLQCSTQPIFSNFPSMDDLRLALIKEAEAIFQRCIEAEIAQGLYPPYKASGMAYIRFAQEEPQLFRLLYMQPRPAEDATAPDALFGRMTDLVQQQTCLKGDDAALMHLEIWAFVHGLAVLCATSFLPLEEEMISRMVTDAFQGLKSRHEQKEDEHARH